MLVFPSSCACVLLDDAVQWVGVKRFLRALLLTALIVGAMFLLWWLALRAGYFVPVIFGKGIANGLSPGLSCRVVSWSRHPCTRREKLCSIRSSSLPWLFSTVVVTALDCCYGCPLACRLCEDWPAVGVDLGHICSVCSGCAAGFHQGSGQEGSHPRQSLSHTHTRANRYGVLLWVFFVL